MREHPRICDVETPEPIKPLLTRFGEAGFVAELGYRASGSVGPNKSIFKKYIPKKPESYRRLSVTDTMALLEQFSNGLDV